MKKIIQNIIKFFFDLVIFPFLFLYAFSVKFIKCNKIRKNIFLGLMSNNNLIYVREALKKKGYNAQVIPWIIPTHERNIIDYDLNIELRFPKLYKNFFGQLILIYAFFIWALYKFDLFILPFSNRLLDRTYFLSWFEFQFIHLAGKKIILNPYGGDIQYSEVWKESHDKTKKVLLEAWESDPYYSKIKTRQTKKKIKYGEKHADTIIASLECPDYLKKIDYYFHMRVMPSIKIEIINKQINPVFTLLHATNHPHFKGTNFIKKAIKEINKQGEKCRLIVLEKTENSLVLEHIKQADVVVDQLLAGAYGRLAIEAMSLGKPVICYLREDLKELYQNWDECPIINANIVNLKEKILELMTMTSEKRQEICMKSINYVRKYHSPEYVGEKLHTIIQKVLKT